MLLPTAGRAKSATDLLSEFLTTKDEVLACLASIPAGSRLLKYLKEQAASALKLEASVSRVKEACANEQNLCKVDDFIMLDKELNTACVLEVAGKESLSILGKSIASWLTTAGQKANECFVKALGGDDEILYDDSGVMQDVAMVDLGLQLGKVGKMHIIKYNTAMSKQLAAGITLLQTLVTGPIKTVVTTTGASMHALEKLAAMLESIVNHGSPEAVATCGIADSTLSKIKECGVERLRNAYSTSVAPKMASLTDVIYGDPDFDLEKVKSSEDFVPDANVDGVCALFEQHTKNMPALGATLKDITAVTTALNSPELAFVTVSAFTQLSGPELVTLVHNSNIAFDTSVQRTATHLERLRTASLSVSVKWQKGGERHVMVDG